MAFRTTLTTFFGDDLRTSFTTFAVFLTAFLGADFLLADRFTDTSYPNFFNCLIRDAALAGAAFRTAFLTTFLTGLAFGLTAFLTALTGFLAVFLGLAVFFAEGFLGFAFSSAVFLGRPRFLFGASAGTACSAAAASAALI